MNLRVGVVGAGLIGHRRAGVIAQDSRSTLIGVADVDPERARQASSEFHCEWTTDWEALVSRSEVDAVVVSVFNAYLGSVAIAAARAGKHVLCEKPFGRNAAEAAGILRAFEKAGTTLKVGFNLRFHPAIRSAHQ